MVWLLVQSIGRDLDRPVGDASDQAKVPVRSSGTPELREQRDRLTRAGFPEHVGPTRAYSQQQDCDDNSKKAFPSQAQPRLPLSPF
jgi:hypothetical protein